jgi:predicted ferric reductase
MGYVILVLVFVHSFFLGTDILTRGPVFWWWIFLAVLLGAGILTRQFHKRYKYKVTEVRRENDNVRTIKLKPLGQKMDHHPGQFAFVKFLGDISSEEHHFTLSSSPTDPYLSFTVKELGDFTAELGRLKKGDQAILDGPFGAFSNYLEAGPFLFISGGIGITPIISMVKYMFQNKVNKDSVLVYTVKEKKDLVFADEFDKIDREKWFEVIYRFTEKEGHLDENFFQKIKNLKKRTVYLVGPGAMVESTKALLLGLGVSPGQIHTELFALR